MNRCINFFLIIIVALATGTTSAYSQLKDLDYIASKLSRLERDIQVLSRRAFKGKSDLNRSSQRSLSVEPQTTAGSANIIRLEDRLTGLKDELQNSTNRIEGISHNLDEIKIRLNKLVSDIDFRLTRIESGVTFSKTKEQTLSAAPRAPDVKSIGSPTGGPIMSSRQPGVLGTINEANLSEVKRQANKGMQNSTPLNPKFSDSELKQKFILPKGTPKVQYDYAFSILQKTKYNNAELAFSEFIQRYPKNELTPNARYWLGESFYVRKNYRAAAEAFLRGYQQAPKGVKASHSLLKLGMSLANLKKKQDACATFSKLAKDYPAVSENIRKHLEREFKRSSCK